MSTDADLLKLYSARILALAADIPNLERLADPGGTAHRRAPLCGSTVTVDVACEGGKITEFGQDVKACALGQAAASVVGANVIGLTPEDVRKGRAEMLAMLKDDAPPPQAPFDGLEVLIPARDYKNRHASIMLAFDATLDALAAAGCA
ncbi:iron-sulfur cluster assembly scaffold protein [Lentibacter algarum]|uniref:iron-sulfur cluster assembly scaffold protein n=1 Tax=Lentibacter algarum TaxID=576131 RepID=UPI001C08A34C|nr:iron-sulfur cluster assembly scaffold protein [Lentibacter algarum]MBU2982470.1 iron-sulfur cluster assembly scaffold protein [Lentibacter algarum]